jgi:hypothetical protein
MLIFASSQMPLQITELVFNGKCGKPSAMKGMNVSGLSAIIFFAMGALWKWTGHTFWLKPLEPVFCDMKDESLKK